MLYSRTFCLSVLYIRVCICCAPPANAGDLGSIPEWEDPLEKEMAIHCSILTWRISWTEELVDYSPWGHKESDTTERLSTHTHKDYILKVDLGLVFSLIEILCITIYSHLLSALC